MKTTTSTWIKTPAKIRYGLRLVVGETEINEFKTAAK